jgi:hypothetical protein
MSDGQRSTSVSLRNQHCDSLIPASRLRLTRHCADGASHGNRGDYGPNSRSHEDGAEARVLARPLVPIYAGEDEQRDQAANCVSFETRHVEMPFIFRAFVSSSSSLVHLPGNPGRRDDFAFSEKWPNRRVDERDASAALSLRSGST